jgi:ankyrin repeat protein
MDALPDIFEFVCNGDYLPFHVTKTASGYGAKHNGWRTKDDEEFYADMLPKLKPGGVILQINDQDVLYSDFEHIDALLDPSEKADGTLPARPLVLLMRAHVSKWAIVRKNLEFIATVLKDRWGVGETDDEKEQFRLLCTDFLRCARMGRVDQMKIYLAQHPPADLDFQDSVGATALHVAVANKDIGVSQLLLQRDADLFMTDNNGLTALHVAVAQGSVDLAHAILKKRTARLAGLLHEEENFGRTVVHLCAISGKVDVLKILITMSQSNNEGNDTRKLDLFLKDKQWGWEPLHYAAHYGHTAMIHELLRLGANIFSRTKGRKTVLMLAQEGNHVEALAYLQGRLKEQHMHRVMETSTEPWLGSGTAEIWVGNLDSTKEKYIIGCDITVVIQLVSDETREQKTDIEDWLYGDEDEEEEEEETELKETPVGEYDEYGLKMGSLETKENMKWSVYYSEEYDATFYLDSVGTVQWEEPWGVIKDEEKENKEGKEGKKEDFDPDFTVLDGDIQYYYFSVQDGDDVNAWRSVLKKLPRIATLISKQLHNGEHVLVQCVSGTRASVAALLGFMLTKRGLPNDPDRALPFFRLKETLTLFKERIPNWAPGRTFLNGFQLLQDGLDTKRTKQAWNRVDALYRGM